MIAVAVDRLTCKPAQSEEALVTKISNDLPAVVASIWMTVPNVWFEPAEETE